MKTTALSYLQQGLSIIPCDKKKKPLITSWLPYQKEPPTEQQVGEWWDRWPDANIAVVTGEVSGIDIVDIDEQQGFVALSKYIPAGISTPAVKTPRGGMHLYFQHHPGLRNNARAIPGCDLRAEGGYAIMPPSSNGDGKPYAWIKQFNRESLASLPNAYISFINSFSLYRDSSSPQNQSFNKVQHDSSFFVIGRRDEDLFHVANSLVKGNCNPDIAMQALRIIAESCDPPFPKDELEIKLKSAMDRAKRRERNLTQEVSDFIDSSNGIFFSSELEKVLHCSSLPEIKNLSQVLRRLADKGVIEKAGKKNGCWRKVDQSVDIIDWQNAPDEEYPISLPLDLHDLCKVYPGNIIVLAGASNTGKTSFMLETIRMNQDKHKVVYFNSEMGATELRLRLSMFDCPLSSWKFKAVERSSNFADVIEPDALNIIDFMEVYDDFWKIGGWIRDVHEKLKSGVAIIAIQKKSSTTQTKQRYGRGGELSLEKPRLYLAMDRGKIEIVKAKIWREHERNPNGLVRNFKLIGGWEFRPSNEWHRTEEEKYHNDNFIPE